jgi:hypothetical protein
MAWSLVALQATCAEREERMEPQVSGVPTARELALLGGLKHVYELWQMESGSLGQAREQINRLRAEVDILCTQRDEALARGDQLEIERDQAHEDNYQLRAENASLKEALQHQECPTCLRERRHWDW